MIYTDYHTFSACICAHPPFVLSCNAPVAVLPSVGIGIYGTHAIHCGESASRRECEDRLYNIITSAAHSIDNLFLICALCHSNNGNPIKAGHTTTVHLKRQGVARMWSGTYIALPALFTKLIHQLLSSTHSHLMGEGAGLLEVTRISRDEQHWYCHPVLRSSRMWGVLCHTRQHNRVRDIQYFAMLVT
jgi:hypothetical protein